MDAGSAGLAGYAADYISNLSTELMAGDVFAVSLTLIIAYLVILFINKLTGLIVFVLKKLFLLFIVTLALTQFIETLYGKILVDGVTRQNIFIGTVGIAVGIVAFIIALYSAYYSFRHAREQHVEKGDEERLVEKPVKEDGTLATDMRDFFSMKNLKSDKHLGAVLSYLVIAEFGVFSSKTIVAPDEMVGAGFFLAFLLAALVFIHQSYQNYKTGLRHLAAALVVGSVLAIILGHFWSGHTLDKLLSTSFFATEAMVALVTGLAVSLFMGSKN